LPNSLHELADYELVVLENVAGFDLSVSKMALLDEYVRDTGGGLISLGGDRSYSAGGYFDTPIERALPVAMDVRTDVRIPSAAVIILVDKSGSMQAAEKLPIAKAAALSAVDVLNPLDRVGVLAFDDEFHWTVAPTDAGNRRQIVERLRPLTSGGSTRLFPALVEAYRAMTQIDAKIKHLIVLSDGLTNSGDNFPELSQQIIDDGITVSTVALGHDSDQTLMQTLALDGGGRYYHTEDPQNVPRIFTSETLIVTRNLTVEATTPVRVTESSQWLQDFDPATLPPVLGFQRTYAKPGAEVWLSTPDDEPLLAGWRYGLGKSVAFMSDFSGRWGREWVQWPDFSRFVAQLFRWSARKHDASNLSARFEWRGRRGELVVDALDAQDRFINGLTLQASISGGRDDRREVDLEQTGPGRYRAQFSVAQTGRYYFTVNGSVQKRSLPPLPIRRSLSSRRQTRPCLQTWLRAVVEQYCRYRPQACGRRIAAASRRPIRKPPLSGS
jgi:uncharacterized membrane protein